MYVWIFIDDTHDYTSKKKGEMNYTKNKQIIEGRTTGVRDRLTGRLLASGFGGTRSLCNAFSTAPPIRSVRASI